MQQYRYKAIKGRMFVVVNDFSVLLNRAVSICLVHPRQYLGLFNKKQGQL